MTAQEKVDLANRVARWCFDNTNSWEFDNIGLGLAYLLWAITDSDSIVPFDATKADSRGMYDKLIEVLRANPNGLLDELIEKGVVVT